MTTTNLTAVEEELDTDDADHRTARAVVAAAATEHHIPDFQSSLPRPAIKHHDIDILRIGTGTHRY